VEVWILVWLLGDVKSVLHLSSSPLFPSDPSFSDPTQLNLSLPRDCQLHGHELDGKFPRSLISQPNILRRPASSWRTPAGSYDDVAGRPSEVDAAGRFPTHMLRPVLPESRARRRYPHSRRKHARQQDSHRLHDDGRVLLRL
jgi:hypothetical protein